MRFYSIRSFAAASILMLALVLLLNMSAAAQQKKRVAVLDFEYGTVQTWVHSMFGANVDVGKGVSDLLVEKLLATGKYSLIERSALDKVLKEQNFSNSDRADSTTAAKIGAILGVDAIITGSITKFGSDDSSTGLGGFGRALGGFGVGGVKLKNAKAVVGISARIIDVNTAEILAAVTGNGESKRKGASLAGAGGGGWNSGGGGIDMSNSNFRETLIGEATDIAVTDLANQLGEKASVMPTRVVSVSGLVADVSGATLILNVGTSTGLKVGDKLVVERKVREVRDPASGKVIRAITSDVGSVTITEADASSSVGTFTGTGTAKVGDVVKTP
ncbi:MAG: curli production assembly protein CsgG [Bryobacterales bacterium]|nr:curli production assembly protein CsgG [Bryobacterales bacterium]